MSFFKLAKNKMIHGHIMLYFVSKYIPIILATEYPRSGGTWFCELLSYSLDMYFPTNRFQKIKPGIYHGHYLPSKLMKNIDKTFLIVRYGRDVMVSNYFKRLTHEAKLEENEVYQIVLLLLEKELLGIIEIILQKKPPRSLTFTLGIY